MKKQLIGMVVVLGVLGVLGARPALAQSDEVHIKVPFPFVVGRTTLPAGTYQMVTDVSRPELVLLTNQDGEGEATFFTDFAGALSRSSEASFQFKKIDGRLFLAAITIPGERTRELVVPEPHAAEPHHDS